MEFIIRLIETALEADGMTMKEDLSSYDACSIWRYGGGFVVSLHWRDQPAETMEYSVWLIPLSDGRLEERERYMF